MDIVNETRGNVDQDSYRFGMFKWNKTRLDCPCQRQRPQKSPLTIPLTYYTI